MRYDKIQKKDSFPLMVMESSEYSSNQCVLRNDKFGVWLYHANCIEFMDVVSRKYPDGKFDLASTIEGNFVLDSFPGSSTTGVAI